MLLLIRWLKLSQDAQVLTSSTRYFTVVKSLCMSVSWFCLSLFAVYGQNSNLKSKSGYTILTIHGHKKSIQTLHSLFHQFCSFLLSQCNGLLMLPISCTERRFSWLSCIAAADISDGGSDKKDPQQNQYVPLAWRRSCR